VEQLGRSVGTMGEPAAHSPLSSSTLKMATVMASGG